MSAQSVSRSGVSNLEQQRKRAKDLVRAHRQQDADAAARVVRHLPRASGLSVEQTLARGLSLSEAQLVVAREAGFPSWPRLKQEIELAHLGVDRRLEALLEAALSGNGARVRSMVSADPDVTKRSIHLAAALGDANAVLAILDAQPAAAVARGGGKNWTPLFYLCAARFRRGDAEAARDRVRSASRLIDLGADPKEEVADGVAPGGFRSLLQAAAADVASEELVSLLIDRGALLEPTGAAAGTSFPLTDAVIGGNPLCVRRILEAKPPSWEAREALELAIVHDDLTSVQLLLAYGAEANGAGRWWGQHGSCLHSAVLLGRGRKLLEALLAGGVDISVRDSDRRTAYQAAVRTAHVVAVELLQKHGASDAELDDVDRLIAACVAGHREVLSAAKARPMPRFRRTDHQFLCWAIRHDRHTAIPLLLEAGLDPNVPDDHGETALHLAGKSGNAETIWALRARGANLEARNFLGETPFDNAPDPDERRSRDELFERAVTAVVEGKLEELREMLDEEPDLVHARSRRSHRATLLHYVAANGTERQEVPPNAAQVAELLLERGAVADAECHMYGGGETTLGLVISSVFPERAGLTGDLVRVLVRGGARVGGRDDEGDPLSGAIDCGSRLGVEALVECGAIETPAAAAALGHIELLERRLELEPHMAGVALVIAARFGRVAVLETLLARGIDVNSRPAHRGWPDGVTALHQAAWNGKIDAVRCLLDHGADPTIRDSTHHGTPAGWASHSGNHAIAELISSRERLLAGGG